MSDIHPITKDILHDIIYDFITSSDFIKSKFRIAPDSIKLDIKEVIFAEDSVISNWGFVPSDYKSNKYRLGSGGLYNVRFRYEGIYRNKNLWVNFGGFENERYKDGDFFIFKTEYTSNLRDKKLKSLNITLEDKIKNNIDNYLGFDSQELFRDKSKLVRIFGGAVRDSIAGDPINDIDILCGSKAIEHVRFILTSHGYKYNESLTPKDLSSVYSDIHVINEPHTWMKGDKIIQLIRPSIWKDNQGTLTPDTYKEGFENLIANVDISCCGVSYDGNLYENYKNSILHCQQRVFSVNKEAKMYSYKRILYRIEKFVNRGWKEIENTTQVNRNLKLDNILNEQI